MFNLTGKKALITGASGGIGSSIAREMHKMGAHLVISGTNEDKLNDLKNELGENVEIIICDLSNLEDSAKLVADTPDLSILVCNAGITKDGLAMRMSDDDFEKVININLKSSFVMNREAIKVMMKNRYGRIINISSVVGFSGNPGQSNYCASKAGLVGMTKSLAMEVASRGITVNSIAPGFIETKMTDALNDSHKEAILSKIPVKKMGEARDIAFGAIYLASDEAKYVTGQTLHINGGMLMP